MPIEFAQGNRQYMALNPRLHDDNCDLGIGQFLADSLLGEVMRKFLIEMYETTADEMYGR